MFSDHEDENTFTDYAKNIGIPKYIIDMFCPSPPNEEKKLDREIYYPFELPIKYLDKKNIHFLSKTVIDDLELDTTIYKTLFKPKNDFGQKLMKEWGKQFTTDVMFLKETQRVIKDMEKFDLNFVDTNRIMEIWGDTKENKNFLDKYHFMDWERLKYLNNSSSFLQMLSIANVLSPLIGLLIPVIFIILPFIIIKIRGVPITFEVYMNIFKGIAKNHFLGSTLSSIENITFDKLVYIILTFGLYILQIYQNTQICKRFYSNLKLINKNLIDVRTYIEKVSYEMKLFIQLHASKKRYRTFCSDLNSHLIVLSSFSKELSDIDEFKPDISKACKCGYLLKCYYNLQNNEHFDLSLRYAFGFTGYIDNLRGVFENTQSREKTGGNNRRICSSFPERSEGQTKKISCAFFKKISPECKNITSFEGQYYPPFKDNDDIVVNDVKLINNIIITGPNASGKTTLLKTTAINIIITQQLGYGFYEKCNLIPYTHIHSYLNIPDTSERDSLFQAETRRCKNILDTIINTGSTSRHFCISDELYSGTNPSEATKAAHAFLLYMCKYKNVDFILTTHYNDVCYKFQNVKTIKDKKKIVNYKMNTIEFNDKIEYKYTISKGISEIQGAIRVFEEMGYPEEILNSFKNY
jgi:energy-coupling factor transporter ATP-binding protein EcfA2